MANYQIPLTYVVSATAVAGGRGLEPLQLSTILLLTNEETVAAYEGDYMIARTTTSVINAYGTEATVSKMAQAIFSQNPNILNSNGYVIIANYEDEETTAQAIQRLSQQIFFEGIISAKDLANDEVIAASNLVESMPERILFVTGVETSVLSGLFTTIKDNAHTRKLLYTAGATPEAKKLNAKLFASAFASRGLSVNYTGSNTTLTMTYKDLAGVPVDTNISESILNTCETVGADVYCSIEGLAKVISFKQGGLYFDQLANRIWLTATIQRDVANLLFTTRTKVPQTEAGLSVIKNAITRILEQGVLNGMIGAGIWNRPDTFGVLEDFHRGIRTNGYYVYHMPISEQSQTEREERKAPLFSIAAKEQGAIEHCNIMIYVEA